MNNIKLRELTLLFLVIIVFINFFYYRYGYKTNQNKLVKLTNELVDINNKLQLEQEMFLNNLKLFDKMMEYHNSIGGKEISIWYLEKNIDLKDQISDVIKQLFIDSGIKFSSLNLADTAKDGNKKFYTFDIKFTTTISNLLHLIDTIENHKKPMQITNINITNNEKNINVDMTLKLITLENL